MNKNILFVILLGGFLVGCISPQPRDGNMFGANGTVNVSGCAAPMAAMACEGDGKKPVVEFDLDTLTADPECIVAEKGKVITFVLKPTKNLRKGTVVVFPEKADNYFWLAGENSLWYTKKKIKIRVPKEYKSGDPFPDGIVKYGVFKRSDNKCIDPRIHVRN